MSFLDPTTIAELQSLPVKARVIVEGALTGLHRARLHGSSVEFAEHKEYSPGDDVRHIDWKAYAKADRYYIKQFEQESELVVQLVLDASGSMSYKNRGLSKLEYGSYLMAALAYLLIRQRDKVGLTIFGDPTLDRYVPPRARPAHLRDLLAVLEETNRGGARGDEPLGAALDRVAELTARRGGLIVLASDFFDSGGRGLTILRRLRSQGHDVVAFQVLDADEIEFPFEGLTLFESLEEDRRLLANPAAIRRQYQRRLDEFLAHVKSECTTGGVDYVLANTSEPLEEALIGFLRTRSRGPGRITA